MRDTEQARRDLAFGDWMRARRSEMKPDKWTQQTLAKEVSLTGLAVTREWINQVENGSHPSDDLRRAIERLLGPAPQTEPTEAVSLESLVASINDLVAEMRRTRETQADWNSGVQQVVESLAALVHAQPTKRRGRAPLGGAER